MYGVPMQIVFLATSLQISHVVSLASRRAHG